MSSRPEPIIGVEEAAVYGALLVGSLSFMAAVALVAQHVVDEHQLVGFHSVVVAGLAVAGVAFAFVGLRFPSMFSQNRIIGVLVVGIPTMALASWAVGPKLAPYIDMSFLWMAMAAHLYLGRRAAALTTGWIGVAYATVLALQRHNPAAVSEWVLVIGAATVSGLLVGGLAARIRDLVDQEHALLGEVEASRRGLEMANRQRSDFLSSMSHELRTPLNAIIGFADVLAERLFGGLSEEQAGLVGVIQTAGGRLMGLVGDVLDLEDEPGVPPHPTVSPKGAETEPALRADPRGSLAFFLLAPVALATLPRPLPHDLRFGPVLAIAVAGALIDQFVLRGPLLRPDAKAFVHIVVVTAAALGLALFAGAAMSPYATIFLMWMATAAALRLKPAGIVFSLLLIALGEAVLVSIQPGNGLPFVRWEVTTGTAIVSAFVIRRMVNRLVVAADREAVMRRAADDARSNLISADRHKTAFLHNLRHEMRPQLEAVADAATGLSVTVLSDRQSEYVGDIQSAGRHLQGLVADMLDLATVEQGRMELDVGRSGLAALVDGAVESLRLAAAAGGIELTVTVVPAGATVWADAAKLGRAVTSLVSNGVKFTPRGGAVRVRAFTTATEVRIEVTDTGTGIAPDQRDRIFEGFNQGAAATTAPGAGVGLTLAQRFVQLMGGTVELVSERGAGSAFTIVLPQPVLVSPAGAGSAGSGGSGSGGSGSAGSGSAGSGSAGSGLAGGAGTLAR